ncbi:MAG TPA: signal peptide peptidase SppA [Candidatus Eremiobacteraeota bacterium]|nr:MAG: putative signal peptide peptidase SppA [bacterium ADurb.Bin363]HPZ07900.1 signal peptide peptidase SppA [Candidatus Eremiobacteraeota bacterium]
MDTPDMNKSTIKSENMTQPPLPPPEKNKQKRGKPLSFWMSIILGFLFILSMSVNIMLFILLGATMMKASDTTMTNIGNEKYIQGEKNSKNKILLVPVNGIIIEQDVESVFYNKKSIVQEIKDTLSKAEEDQNIKAIILSINSPGGGISECEIIYSEIIKFKKKKAIPIIVSMGQVAASGGYYISAPATEIFAQPSTITGSIGVIMELTNMEELFDKVGLKSVTIKSGKLKDIGSATRKMTKEEEEILNSIIQEMSGRFLDIVKDGRKLSKEHLQVISDARIFTALQAKEIGLVDKIGYLGDAFDSAKKHAGLKDAKLIKYKKNLTFFDFLEETSKNLNINPESEFQKKVEHIFPETPRLMYIWRTY